MLFVGATWVLVWRKVVLRLRLRELVPRGWNESGAAALPKYQAKAQYTVWLGSDIRIDLTSPLRRSRFCSVKVPAAVMPFYFCGL
jgi:hypothetical protein